MILTVVFAFALVAFAQSQIYVSPNGNDNNPGTQSLPFLTIQRAQTAVRTLIQDGLKAPVTVNLDGGLYSLVESGPLVFSELDSGTADFPITYITTPGSSEQAIIHGGFPISNWVESTTTQGLWTAQLPSTTTNFHQLWANGVRQLNAATEVMVYANLINDTVIQFQEGQITAIPHNLQDVIVATFESWTASLHPLVAVNLTASTITIATPFNQQFYGPAYGDRYILYNYLESLDEEGEFYYDTVSNVVSWLVPNGENPNEMLVIAPELIELIIVNGSSHLQFVNLTVSYTLEDYSDCFNGLCDDQSAAFLTTATVHVMSSPFISFNDVTVSHIGGYGIWIDYGSNNNTVESCVVIDMGGGGIRVGTPVGGILPASQMVDGTLINNTYMLNGGFIFLEASGILAHSVSNSIFTHNLISNLSYTGISVGWTWGYAQTSTYNNYIGFNIIRYINMQGYLSDMGCIYTLGIQRGTIVNNNVCHDLWAFNYGGWGYYTDEGSSFMVYSNNIAFGTKCAGIHQHYGENNTFINNVLGEVNVGFLPGNAPCDGALRSSPDYETCSSTAYHGCTSFDFKINIIYENDGPLFYGTTPTAFNNISFDYNTYWITSEPGVVIFPGNDNLTEWQEEGKDIHSIIANPEFVSPGNDWNDLQANSPSFALGFVPIPADGVGPTTSTSTSTIRAGSKYAHLKQETFDRIAPLGNYIK